MHYMDKLPRAAESVGARERRSYEIADQIEENDATWEKKKKRKIRKEKKDK